MLIKAPLISVLLHPIGRRKFREHLVNELAMESLDFWEAVHDLKMNTRNDEYRTVIDALGSTQSKKEHAAKTLEPGSAEMLSHVRMLYDTFIEGPRQVRARFASKKV